MSDTLGSEELEHAKRKASILKGTTRTRTSVGLAAIIISLLSFLTVITFQQNHTIADLSETLQRRTCGAATANHAIVLDDFVIQVIDRPRDADGKIIPLPDDKRHDLAEKLREAAVRVREDCAPKS